MWFKRQSPKLIEIYLASAAGQAMQRLERVNVLAGEGLEDDRYALGNGHWHKVESCQLTIITKHELTRMQRRMREPLINGIHRRNLVLGDIKPAELRGRDLAIGNAIFRYQRPRPPCGYIDQLTGLRLAKAMGRDAGACFQVIQSGVIQTGDEVTILGE
ncbi:MAG: MOSC domain-containing protein [Thiotrichales bacterium]